MKLLKERNSVKLVKDMSDAEKEDEVIRRLKTQPRRPGAYYVILDELAWKESMSYFEAQGEMLEEQQRCDYE
jgi:hypothetical protein